MIVVTLGPATRNTRFPQPIRMQLLVTLQVSVRVGVETLPSWTAVLVCGYVTQNSLRYLSNFEEINRIYIIRSKSLLLFSTMQPKITRALWYIGLAVVSSRVRSKLRRSLPLASWLASLATLSCLARIFHFVREYTLYQRRRKGGQLPTAVITGAASGIGLATAQRLYRAGFIVGLLDVNPQGLENAARLVRGKNDYDGTLRVHVATCDIRDQDQCRSAIAKLVEKAGGKLDVLFNNAGILQVGKFVNMPLQQQLKQVQVNLNGVCIATRAALPALQATAGSVVVNMASSSSFYGCPSHAVYSATKHGVRALTEALSIELESSGVRVVDVNVSYVKTPMVSDLPKTSVALRDVSSWRTPDEVAATVERAIMSPDPGRLHYFVDWGTWGVNMFIKFDNLCGFGLTPFLVKSLAMTDE